MKSAPLASLPNPWSLTMYQKALDKTADSSGTTDFILLENLTAKFKRPCVMDIKIGKRTYADDASPKKRARAEAKCRATTSHVLGFRLCGMQVYSEPNGRYLRKDKYYGRELTPATVPDALSRFFSLNLDKPLNSSPRAQEIVKALSDRLATLREALRTLSGMRFYSSSVLVVYEGDVSVRRSPESLVDLRIIDFANTPLGEVDGPDDTFIVCLTTLESMLRGLVESQVCGQ
jgi:inositol-hexakisphosphate kinase